MGLSSGLANSYEVFSGNRIGDGTFTRVLGATAAVTGGFFAPGVSSFGTFGRSLSGASGLVSGYEIASGNTIGDGTFSTLFHVSNLGVNQGSTLFNSTASAAQRFSVGLNLAVGGASLVNTGDRNLQQALRSLSIASGVWNTGSSAVTAYHSTRATLQALRPKPIQVQATGSGIRLASGGEADGGKVIRAHSSDSISGSSPDYTAFEEYLAANPENSPIKRRSAASIRQDTDAFEGWLLTQKYGLKKLQIAGPIRIVNLNPDQPPGIANLTSEQLALLTPFLPPSDRDVENQHVRATLNEAQRQAVEAARIRQERMATVSNSDDLWANLDYMEAGQVPLTANFRNSFYEADYVIASEHNQRMAQAHYAAANLIEVPIQGLSMLPGGGAAKVAVYHLYGESQDPLSAYFDVVGSLAPFGLSQLGKVGKPVSTVASFGDDIFPLPARFSGTGRVNHSLGSEMTELGTPVTHDGIVLGLRGTTNQATRIADALGTGQIEMEILSYERFQRLSTFLDAGNARALHLQGTIYINQASLTPLSDVVHEGTHALQRLNGIERGITQPRQVVETQAYLHEKFFRRNIGLPSTFESQSLEKFVFRNYESDFIRWD